jgi:hypothetical protein
MNHSDKLIREHMARLGRQPKRMTAAAIAQRSAAGRAPRRRAAAPPRPPRDRRAVLAQSDEQVERNA